MTKRELKALQEKAELDTMIESMKQSCPICNERILGLDDHLFEHAEACYGKLLDVQQSVSLPELQNMVRFLWGRLMRKPY